jgi:hypothetical protein
MNNIVLFNLVLFDLGVCMVPGHFIDLISMNHALKAGAKNCFNHWHAISRTKLMNYGRCLAVLDQKHMQALSVKSGLFRANKHIFAHISILPE